MIRWVWIIFVASILVLTGCKEISPFVQQEPQYKGSVPDTLLVSSKWLNPAHTFLNLTITDPVEVRSLYDDILSMKAPHPEISECKSPDSIHHLTFKSKNKVILQVEADFGGCGYLYRDNGTFKPDMTFWELLRKSMHLSQTQFYDWPVTK